MRVYENESSQQLKQRLRASVELGMYRSAMVLVLIFSGVIIGLFLLFTRHREELLQLRWIMAAVLGACCLPMVGICLFRIITIWRKWEHYTYHQVKLVNLHRTLWAEYSYFTVALDDGTGGKQIVNTHAIFTTHTITTPLLEDYVNRQAVVGYNETTGQVVFLG